VTGSFDDWAPEATPRARDGDGSSGTWSADIEGVKPGDEYRYRLRTAYGNEVWRMDPYARQVTSSVGNAVVYDPAAFDWSDHSFEMPARDDLVIYELHVGTFNARDDRQGDFDRAVRRLPYLRDLGISAVQVMPPFEFAGDVSWGYNPAHLFAIESGYGGPDAFKRFIKAAHEHGIAVIVDVVYNHLGPTDLDLWQFDGWSANGGGGIYFYNDERAITPWGNTRPDYGRGEVRTFLRDSALTWLEEFQCDGLRFDSTLFIRTVDGVPGNPASALPDGWSFMAWLNDEIRARQPWKLTIAEDIQDDTQLVTPTAKGGAGFGAQWDIRFIRAVRPSLETGDDRERSIRDVVEAITAPDRGAPLTRVIYTESHDDVANDRVRLPEAIKPGDAGSWWSEKRATLGSALVLTSPGIPMLFQGQELLEDRWFDDTVALDWGKAGTHEGIVRLHHDLIALRRGGRGTTRGLRGEQVEILRADDRAKLLAFHRWHEGGRGDDVVVVANFTAQPIRDLRLGFPAVGRWRVRLNSDSPAYAPDFGGQDAFDTETDQQPMDGCSQSALVSVGPYGVVILSQDA
jgi:1,4-alpha-glucan branching enzyme